MKNAKLIKFSICNSPSLRDVCFPRSTSEDFLSSKSLPRRSGRTVAWGDRKVQSENCNFNRAGFTLIEILIAVTIISILVAALYSTFFLSQKAIGAVDESLIKLQEARVMIDALKREMESAFYSQDKPYSVFKIVDRDFYGRQASEVLFTASSSLIPGLSIINYTLEEEGGKLVLRKKIVSAYSPTDDTRNIELIENIGSFTVEARYDNDWIRTWDSALIRRVPDEIKVSVTIIIGDRQKQISISDIAKPKIGRSL